MDATNQSVAPPEIAADAPPEGLEARLTTDMRAAMKSGDRDRLGVIRMVLSEVRAAGMATPPVPAEQAAGGYARKLRKGIEEFASVGNAERAERLRIELAVVESYLPARPGGDRTAELVEQFLAKSNFAPTQVGPATGAFMKAHGREADGAEASRLIRERLGGK